MDNAVLFWIAFTATLFAVVPGYLQIRDSVSSGRISKTRNFPIVIKRSIRASSYYRALATLRKQIEVNNRPDIVVAVSYGGLGPAAELAGWWLVPVRLVEVEVDRSTAPPKFGSATATFNESQLDGKHVLLVDNSIRSGETLKNVKEQLEQQASSVTTVVVYRPGPETCFRYNPDKVVFYSNKKLERLIR